MLLGLLGGDLSHCGSNTYASTLGMRCTNAMIIGQDLRGWEERLKLSHVVS